jgi:hypothetical protein
MGAMAESALRRPRTHRPPKLRSGANAAIVRELAEVGAPSPRIEVADQLLDEW